jgi:hypothetical protein
MAYFRQTWLFKVAKSGFVFFAPKNKGGMAICKSLELRTLNKFIKST